MRPSKDLSGILDEPDAAAAGRLDRRAGVIARLPKLTNTHARHIGG